ncbi:MAG: dihydrofolate reductase [Oscillospiraceae bacterium]|nr:dihydrofolate reductase [Oscillospiraceae bacterium]MCL2126410.1 dihydrofolate reductase [Oscillospiraceae bacterium]
MQLIVAVNSDWGIGYNNTQSVVLPEDRRHFKALTDGGTVIAGRKTFEDFGRPLPNRKNIVLTRNMSYNVDGIIIAHSVDEALTFVAGDDADMVFIIGGGSIYTQFLNMCSHAHVTKINAMPPSDTYFPNLDESSNWYPERRGEPAISSGVEFSFDIYHNNSIRRAPAIPHGGTNGHDI